MAGRDARQRRGYVVGHVEQHRDARSSVLTVAGLEQFGGAKDEQGRGAVAELESAHAHEQPPYAGPQHRANLETDRLPFPCSVAAPTCRAAKHGERGQQSGTIETSDRRAHVEQCDQHDRQQRPDDGAEVVGRTLESIRPPVRGRVHDVGEDALREGPRTPRAAQAPVRNTPTCHAAVARPTALESTRPSRRSHRPRPVARRRGRRRAHRPPTSRRPPPRRRCLR